MLIAGEASGDLLAAELVKALNQSPETRVMPFPPEFFGAGGPSMAEAGVDISQHTSKHVETLAHVPFDYVVTVCDHAHETCPIFPGKTRVVHVGFDDPPTLAKSATSEEDAMRHYRRVRDEIRTWIATLPKSLSTSA